MHNLKKVVFKILCHTLLYVHIAIQNNRSIILIIIDVTFQILLENLILTFCLFICLKIKDDIVS